MKNIYDIRREKQLQFILSTEHSAFTPDLEMLQSCAVVVNLYYIEKVAFYVQYMNQLPEEVALYVFSSQGDVLERAKECCTHGNTLYLKKENRGRDLSAFLVAFRSYAEQYEYVCFLHDKKEHHPVFKEDVEKWNENLWGNMIATKQYVYNVLHLFAASPKLGILFPPEPLGKRIQTWYRGEWGGNFDNCVKLADKLSLSADIKDTKPCISYGSVFWMKRNAALKLWNTEWKYEDFPEEPMPKDYTISHAVERILGYVAQDAGYDVGTVMTEAYASWMLLFIQDDFKQMFSELSLRMGISDFMSLYVFVFHKGRALDYVRAHESVYLYGAGKYGKILLRVLREEGMEPVGFAVTNKNPSQDSVDGLQVLGIEELPRAGEGIILTVGYSLQDEMIHVLQEKGIKDYMVLFT